MGMLVATGWRANQVERFASTLSSSHSPATGYSNANLYDGYPDVLWRAAAHLANPYWKIDRQLLANGGFDADLASWTSSSTGIASTAWDANDGVGASGCLALVPGGPGDVAARYQDITVRPGDWLRFTLSAKAAVGGVTRMRIRNLITGAHVSAAGVWGAAAVDAITITTNAANHTQGSVTIQVEPFRTCGREPVTLRIEVLSPSDNTQFVDDVLVVPGMDCAAWFGHTFDPVFVPYILYSDDDVSYPEATYASGGGYAPTKFFLRPASMLYNRWIRVGLTYTGVSSPTPDPPAIGELVIAQTQALGAALWHPEAMQHRRSRQMAQVVNETQTGRRHVVNLGTAPRDTESLPYYVQSESDDDELMHDLWRRSSCGATPALLIPESAERAIYLVQLRGVHADTRTFGYVGAPFREGAIEISELPFAAIGA